MAVVARGNVAINERYRPMRLSELIGNEKVKAGLTSWMSRGEKRSRALLLAGASSGGKTTTARILAMGLNCEKGDTTEPCLECPSCRAAMAGGAYHIIEHNMSDTTTKDETQLIVDDMHKTALTGRNKVYILDEVQSISTASQNMLLKTVEQPPDGVYIIFCTTDPDKLIKPLRNRCEMYTYGLPTRNDIAELLKSVIPQEGYEMTNEQKIEFFDFVQGMPYREILFNLEQYMAGAGTTRLNEKSSTDPFYLAKEIIYNGNFQAYANALDKGENLDFEGLRRLMRGLAGKEIEKAGMRNLVKGAAYVDIMSYLDEKPLFDQNPRPSASALVWRICACVLDSRSQK